MRSMSCTFCLLVDKLAIVRIFDQMPVVSTVEFSCLSFKTTEEIKLNKLYIFVVVVIVP